MPTFEKKQLEKKIKKLEREFDSKINVKKQELLNDISYYENRLLELKNSFEDDLDAFREQEKSQINNLINCVNNLSKVREKYPLTYVYQKNKHDSFNFRCKNFKLSEVKNLKIDIYKSSIWDGVDFCAHAVSNYIFNGENCTIIHDDFDIFLMSERASYLYFAPAHIFNILRKKNKMKDLVKIFKDEYLPIINTNNFKIIEGEVPKEIKMLINFL